LPSGIFSFGQILGKYWSKLWSEILTHFLFFMYWILGEVQSFALHYSGGFNIFVDVRKREFNYDLYINNYIRL